MEEAFDRKIMSYAAILGASRYMMVSSRKSSIANGLAFCRRTASGDARIFTADSASF